MPISSITASTNGSFSPCRTPAESTKIRWPCRYFMIAAAIGERTEFSEQANRMAEGSEAMALEPPSPEYAGRKSR